jgi:enoyl-CoA hydratase/carnithine racemase
VNTVEWDPGENAENQLKRWCGLAAEPGVLRAVFARPGGATAVGWVELAPWTQSRAVTVAEVEVTLAGPALDVALCSDLVYLRRGVELVLTAGEPSAGLVWALGRAGRAALARGLLDPTRLDGDEAVRLGLAQRVLDEGESPLVSTGASVVALTTARDLMRSSSGARSELELASFRLLFASGDPGEGARAFFDRRPPDFEPR